MGCAFRLRRVGETASRFGAIFRVALSATHPIRKPRPTIQPKTGSHFPEHTMQGIYWPLLRYGSAIRGAHKAMRIRESD